MPRKKTNEEFVLEISKISPHIHPLEQYKKYEQKILVENLKCGHKYKTSPNCLYRGHDCPICTLGTGMRKTDDKHIENIYKYNKNVLALSLFSKNGRKYVNCKCLLCDENFTKRVDSLMNGKPCPKCSKRKSHDEYVNEFYKNKNNTNISIISRYRTSKDNIDFNCKICGYKWSNLPKNMIRGVGCPKCNGYIKKTYAKFLEEVKKYNNNLDYLTEYDGADNYMYCKCKKCNYVFFVRAGHLLEGSGCPVCNTSKGENIISKYLSDRNIPFELHKKYDDLFGTGGGNLSYDFHLPGYNILIEFQGMQHEKSFDYFGGEQRFKIQQEHDKRKREYAKTHNIELLEIWYYDYDNIETILHDKLNELQLNNAS